MAGTVLADWKVNSGNLRAQLLLAGFRLTKALRTSPHRPLRMLGRGSDAIYRFLSMWVLTVELPWLTEVGPRLRLHHPQGIVINARSRIGSDVEMRHGVTLGGRLGAFDCPTIGDRVDVGAGASIIGNITVGEGARIGIGAVVLQDVPPGGTAYGNPARVTGAATESRPDR